MECIFDLIELIVSIFEGIGKLFDAIIGFFERVFLHKKPKEKTDKLKPWVCSECGEMNGATAAKCMNCRCARPLDAEEPPRPEQPDPWVCPECGALNLGNLALCCSCNKHKPR